DSIDADATGFVRRVGAFVILTPPGSEADLVVAVRIALHPVVFDLPSKPATHVLADLATVIRPDQGEPRSALLLDSIALLVGDRKQPSLLTRTGEQRLALRSLAEEALQDPVNETPPIERRDLDEFLGLLLIPEPEDRGEEVLLWTGRVALEPGGTEDDTVASDLGELLDKLR